jgi:hypothetical protein
LIIVVPREAIDVEIKLDKLKEMSVVGKYAVDRRGVNDDKEVVLVEIINTFEVVGVISAVEKLFVQVEFVFEDGFTEK